VTANVESARPRGRVELEVWVRRGCALVVAVVAANSSFEHQRGFALRGGADPTTAMRWPLSAAGDEGADLDILIRPQRSPPAPPLQRDIKNSAGAR
jgi:hypothetical protein